MTATLAECLEADLLVQSIYSHPGGGAGCCWHIVLDDCNYDSVDWIISDWLPTTDCKETDCQALAPLIQKMSMTQRSKLALGGYRRLHELQSIEKDDIE